MEQAVFALVTFLAVGGFGLIGLRSFLDYRIKRLQAQGGGGAPGALEDGLAELKDQMYQLRGDVADLQERLEFTERVLTRGQGGEAQPRA
jgi:hypothetical protein